MTWFHSKHHMKYLNDRERHIFESTHGNERAYIVLARPGEQKDRRSIDGRGASGEREVVKWCELGAMEGIGPYGRRTFWKSRCWPGCFLLRTGARGTYRLPGSHRKNYKNQGQLHIEDCPVLDHVHNGEEEKRKRVMDFWRSRRKEKGSWESFSNTMSKFCRWWRCSKLLDGVVRVSLEPAEARRMLAPMPLISQLPRQMREQRFVHLPFQAKVYIERLLIAMPAFHHSRMGSGCGVLTLRQTMSSGDTRILLDEWLVNG